MQANQHDDIDAIIDGALSRYGDATPLRGLEQLVLNRIRLAESSRMLKNMENRLLTRAARNGADVFAVRAWAPVHATRRGGFRWLGLALACATVVVLVAVGARMHTGSVP